MTHNFLLKRLGDNVQKIGSGATPRGGKEVYKNSGISLIRSQNVYNNFFSYDGLAFIDDEQADKLSNVTVESEDILLNITGDSVARVCQVPDEVLPARVNQHVSIIRPDPGVLDVTYLRYFLVSPKMQNYMLALSMAGATRKALTKGMIEDFKIPCPELKEQKAIAAVLSAFDDKIELNRQMIATLEEIARALFKSWFVDFDPVRRNQEARLFPPTASASANEPLKSLASYDHLFPDKLVVEDGREVPKDWRVSAVGKEIKAVGGGTPSTNNPDYWDGGTIHFTTPKDFSNLQSPVLLETARCITERGLNKISSGLLPTGTVLMSSRAPVGYLAINEVPVAINQGFIAMICNKTLSNYFMLFWLMENMHTIERRASGTTFKEISKTNFRPITVVVPPKGIIQKFDDIVGPLYQKIVANEKESRTLAELRDTLLPRLMSGQLRVINSQLSNK